MPRAAPVADCWVLPDYANSDWLRDYNRGTELGHGQYGTTYFATHRTNGHQAAVKVGRQGGSMPRLFWLL